MKRREFLKILSSLPLLGFIKDKQTPRPTEVDEIFAPLWDISSFASSGASIVKYHNAWFFSDKDIIRWCDDDKLRRDKWWSMKLTKIDEFDFWLKDYERFGDSLVWVGKHDNFFKIETHKLAGIDFEISYLGWRA